MERFFQTINNDYTIKVSLERLNYNDIPELLNQIEADIYNWSRFCVHDILWYRNNLKNLICVAVNQIDKIIIFEKINN